MTSLCVFPDTATLTAAIAAHIADAMRSVVAMRGAFHWAVAGGRTPAMLYRALSTPLYADLPWRAVHIWFGDERIVPRNHPDNNFRMVQESLLDQVPIPVRHIHPMPSDLQHLRQEASAYTRCLETHLPTREGVPSLDLVLLGMGPDGHVASLFPGSCALHAHHPAAVANYAPGPQVWRVTLTQPMIDYAQQVLLLVAGADKAAAVARVFEPRSQPTLLLPVQRLEPRGTVTWYLDAAAASLITPCP